MTVKELIEELKEMPEDANVASIEECGSFYITEVTKDENTVFIQ